MRFFWCCPHSRHLAGLESSAQTHRMGEWRTLSYRAEPVAMNTVAGCFPRCPKQGKFWGGHSASPWAEEPGDCQILHYIVLGRMEEKGFLAIAWLKAPCREHRQLPGGAVHSGTFLTAKSNDGNVVGPTRPKEQLPRAPRATKAAKPNPSALIPKAAAD